MFRKWFNRMIDGPESKPARSAQLAAFGKHPGWMDHMDEIGLETDRLVGLRRVLYTEGINGNIDRGAWKKKDGAEEPIPFGHSFIWRFGRDGIVGRLRASTDGRGRALYPIVLAADVVDIPILDAAASILPVLQETENQLVATTSADAARQIIHQAANRVRAIGASAVVSPAPAQHGLSSMADHEDFAPDRSGFHRVMYQIERDVGPLTGEAPAGGRAHHIRVPRCAATPEEALFRWLNAAGRLFPAGWMLMVIAPDAAPWVDLIVGMPTVNQFFCLRATPDQLPLSSEIPYTIEPAFVAKVEGLLSGT